jgi:hypothetical protein
MLSPYIYIGLEKNRDLFALLLESIPVTCLDLSTGPDRFTVREALAHWADWESVHLGRIQAALAEDGVRVPDIDEAQRVVLEGYKDWSLEHIRGLFMNGRRVLIRTLHDLTAEQLGMRFAHSRFGTLTIADYSGHILGHDAYHAEQLTRVAWAELTRAEGP